MKIADFNTPKEHPYGMLEGFGLKHTYEAENTLVWMLIQCIKANRFISILTKSRHPNLVKAGLLQEDGSQYRLTKKALGLLWAYYGKGTETTMRPGRKETA